ncbi:Nitrilase/cyanide hydratase and apolipoprotein N-acyltransferase [Ammonifex degensii KC4]|uniref:Nitrilase/cyanide hydratase and apolipoprotein N-acyltransferase n=1 Tax=Ammonifex degensii (strain DSM 10501 / KC4) TaxID=429009 RepID=C9R8F8_AMMDK|nr:carbon-nitrogen hydrolase family protein [Ammonifex degensii]ACX52587.1 Nitrilase/cyanide hydratase and apolipoprotein N-acyltransferase [Ammonifex degensii KC4]
MRVGVAQTFIADTLTENEATILRMAELAARRGVKLLAFPEMSLTGYHPQTLTKPGFEAELDRSLTRIARRARELDIGLIVGRAELGGKKLFNAATVLLPDGTACTYRKINLTEQEAPYFTPGDKPLVFTFRDYKFGVIICRDQNYPELARQLRREGADALFILAAHFYPPKEARWKLPKNRALPIARAVENGFYVLLANAVGSHLGLVSLGNSLIADSDGCLVALAGEAGEVLLTCDLPEKA